MNPFADPKAYFNSTMTCKGCGERGTIMGHIPETPFKSSTTPPPRMYCVCGTDNPLERVAQ